MDGISSAGDGEVVKLREVGDDKLLHTLAFPTSVRAVAVSADGSRTGPPDCTTETCELARFVI